jgi:hypothetical protein
MTITPDQAQNLLDGATPGPWSSHHDEWEDENGIECEDFYVIGGTDGILSTENFDPDNHDPVANTTLAAAAPDMAETIAGMKTEYAVQSKAGALTQLYYGRDVIWTDTELTAWQVAHEIGGVVVRRFVTDPEVVEP